MLVEPVLFQVKAANRPEIGLEVILADHPSQPFAAAWRIRELRYLVPAKHAEAQKRIALVFLEHVSV